MPHLGRTRRGGTAEAVAPPLRGDGRFRRWLRPLVALDPGLVQLTMATRTACSITLALVGEWLFVEATHALQVPVPVHATATTLATVGQQHHEMLVVAMLLGALVANLQAINGNETSLRPQLLTVGYVGATVSVSLVLGLAIGRHRAVALVVMVLVLVVGSAGRRFGPRGAVAGLLLFIGYFYGFFLSSALGISAAGWLAAEIGVATAAALTVRVALFRPSAGRDVRLAMATYDARVRTVLDFAARLATDPTPATRRRVQRWLVRLGEAALIVDGQLTRGAIGPDAADEIHRRVFDTEVAVTNLARFAELLGTSDPTAERRPELRRALVLLAEGDGEAARGAASAIRATVSGHAPPAAGIERTRWVLWHRFANAVDLMADALARWPATPTTTAPRPPGGTQDGAGPQFNPAVTLRGGLLPGSADVSVEASSHPGARVRIAPYARTAAQMGVAVSVAIVAGDALDAQRFYWAVVAALLALVGTNTVAEQLRKAAYRISGTLGGVVVGTALVDAVGRHSIWSLVTVVVVMWVGVLFMRANYAVLAMAVTISLSQAYLSLGEFSNGLLWERLAETAVGAAAAMLTVVVVVPLRTRRVLDVALARLVEAAVDLAADAVHVLSGGEGDLLASGREVDASYQALVATAQPLRLVGWTDSGDRVTTQVAAATAARNYARNLVADVRAAPALDAGALSAGLEVLRRSAGNLVACLRGEPGSRSYVRAGSLFAEADRSATPEGADRPLDACGPPLALRDLELLDNALAALASADGMTVDRLPPATVVELASRSSGPAPDRSRQGDGRP